MYTYKKNEIWPRNSHDDSSETILETLISDININPFVNAELDSLYSDDISSNDDIPLSTDGYDNPYAAMPSGSPQEHVYRSCDHSVNNGGKK